MRYNIGKKCIELDAAELCLLSLGVKNAYATDADKKAAVLYREKSTDCLLFERYAAQVNIKGRTVELSSTPECVRNGKNELAVEVVRAVSESEFSKKPTDRLWVYAKCAAFSACASQGFVQARVSIVYYCNESGAFKLHEKKLDSESLRLSVAELLSKISFKIENAISKETAVRPSAASAIFPYGDIREGQDEMMQGVTRVIKKGGRMFAQAPTGIGKTISALYPAVRAYGKGLCDKIFYLTAKTDTAREAYSAASRLFSAGARLRTIALSSKDTMCCNDTAKQGGCRDGRYCNERSCPYLKGYCDRAQKAAEELIDMQNGYYSSVITEVALKHKVCPYELSLELSELCDIIICDYNYLFDPFVHIKRYFDEVGRFGEYVFLIDEAHNLVDRARGIYSVTLSKNRIEEAMAAVPEASVELREGFSNMLFALKSSKKLCRDNISKNSNGEESGYYISRNLPDFISEVSCDFCERLGKWVKYNKDSNSYDIINGVYGDMRKFVCILNYYDDKFMTYIELFGGDISFSLNCVDPSDILDGILSCGRASVMFSATLAPLSYFSDLLGGGKQPVCVDLASPYESKNLCVAAVDTVSTRFEDRANSYKKIATCIAAAVSPKAGNYIAYFPSYSYLQKVHEAFVKKYPKVRTIVQSPYMSRAQHEEFILSFKDDENKMRIGFCVLGGSFSEGVDLPGNRLIGSIIVGVGLPGFSSTRNIMRDYFENRYENGFEYAYTYPGMNNVLQAAGRVIRREDDKGIVVLIDDRYSTPTYRRLFPKHWSHLKYVGDAASLAELVRRFWEN